MSFGHFLWSLIIIFFMIIYFMIIFTILIDLFRSRDLSGWAKAVWVLALLIFPLITVVIYLIARGDEMHLRASEGASRARAQQLEVARQIVAETDQRAAGTPRPDPSEQIAKSKQLLDAGAITQAEFDALKAKALA
jgi:hypothetical protein